MNIQIFNTEDGSHSLFRNDLNEGYHSRYGAITESMHVFIEAGFKQVSNKCKEINVLEIGFGTGLNAFLTCLISSETGKKVNYFGIEPFPIQSEIYSKLNYPELLGNAESRRLFLLLHSTEWGKCVKINEHFKLKKIKKRFEGVDLKQAFFNLIYFDAFAADIQPELWRKNIFNKIYNTLRDQGIFVTYSAKGSVKRNLQDAGFYVEKIPGPKGKREMIRAVKKLQGFKLRTQ
ncbi:MAG: tRNA (5-methylaminomethyl-2-thiouridine)(34)-methyltransferase MnmD [Bacteroidetes bacterium]|nr:tRNA (5-methylaminomethyl-2-thiouridine)(34)-methyltransferase MnmD [Bacteroidota bacterium]MBL7103798.1 tRNA (5-methylaminomethyl-2-thiouridine)(34)-methyltransferase MnmD [Bacteroidales bacterium]